MESPRRAGFKFLRTVSPPRTWPSTLAASPVVGFALRGKLLLGGRCVGHSLIESTPARFLERAVSDAGDVFGCPHWVTFRSNVTASRRIANEEIYRLRAQYTTLILLSTLMQGTAVLMPQSMKILGFELLVINLLGLSFPVTLLSKAVKIPGARGRGGFSVHRATAFIAGYVIGIIGAGAVATGREWGMYGVTVSYSLLLFISIWNGWMIMQGIGRGEKLRK